MLYDLGSQEQLFNTSNYRVFLELALHIRKMKNPHFSHTVFVQKSGFASRSFPGDVIRGNKNITLRSLTKVIFGLGLTGVLSRYFTLLVELEHQNLRFNNKTAESISKDLNNLREKFKRKLQNPQIQIKNEMFSQFHRSIIYAALGSNEKGATLSDIHKKTKLESKVCRSELEALVRIGAVDYQETRDNRYRPVQSHLVFADMQNTQDYQKHMASALEEAQKHSVGIIKNESELFLHSVLSVKKRDLTKLKSLLREQINDFVDTSESDEGESLYHLTCTFFEN
jgi:uncharacterized protein (TIGR02147 family)